MFIITHFDKLCRMVELLVSGQFLPYPPPLLFEDEERRVMSGIVLDDIVAVQFEGERSVVSEHLVAEGDVVAGDVGDDPKVELLRPLLRRVPLRLARQDLRRAVHEPDGPSRVYSKGHARW